MISDKIDFQEQENVYKTTSRALMGLTLDADLQQNMSNFVEANQTEGNITNTDITGLYETNKASSKIFKFRLFVCFFRKRLL